MKSDPTRIADAVKALIESGVYVRDFTTARKSLPEFNIETLVEAGKPSVIVTGVSLGGREFDRAWDYLDYGVAVALSHKITREEDGDFEAEVDEVLFLVEQIQDWIAKQSNHVIELEGKGTESDCARLLLPFESDPLFDQQLLRDKSLLLSITTFIYQFEKDRS